MKECCKKTERNDEEKKCNCDETCDCGCHNNK